MHRTCQLGSLQLLPPTQSLQGPKLVQMRLMQDLDSAVEETLLSPTNSDEGMAPVYGMNAKMPDRSIVGEFLTAYQDALLSA